MYKFNQSELFELRSRSALAVNSWVINHGSEAFCKIDYHKRSARVIYLLTTAWQTVICYSIIHTLDLICFDSNTQETYPSDSSNFPPYFDCNTDIYMYFLRLLCAETTLHHLMSRKHAWWEGWRTFNTEIIVCNASIHSCRPWSYSTFFGIWLGRQCLLRSSSLNTRH